MINELGDSSAPGRGQDLSEDGNANGDSVPTQPLVDSDREGQIRDLVLLLGESISDPTPPPGEQLDLVSLRLFLGRDDRVPEEEHLVDTVLVMFEYYREASRPNSDIAVQIARDFAFHLKHQLHLGEEDNPKYSPVDSSGSGLPQLPMGQSQETFLSDACSKKAQHAENLNSALHSLETMRKLNLEIEFSSTSSTPLPAYLAVDHCKCTHCQRASWQKHIKVALDGSRLRRFRGNVGNLFKREQTTTETNTGSDDTEASDSCSPCLTSSAAEDVAKSTPSIDSGRDRGRNILRKIPNPCLICGHPTCNKHASPAFKGHVHICKTCSYLFELDFLVDMITQTRSYTEQCRKKVNELIDCYDRARLLLDFTAQFSDEIASSLESKTVRSNKIGVGSGATNIASGVAGVVGCGALLFPPVAAAGVPLLIASLVFSGGASAVQTGDAAARYFSEPNKLADKMIALHSMALSLLRITEVLSHGLLQNMNATFSAEGFGVNAEAETTQRQELRTEINALLYQHGVPTMNGVVKPATIASDVSAISAATKVGRSSRYFGRVGTTAASSARFVPIAGGLLSAVSVFYESKELKKTLQQMDAGSPCEKASRVRAIRDELPMLPDSELLSSECRRLLDLAEAEQDNL